MFYFIIILGKTKSVEWRIKQLKGLMKMYEENDTLFYDALDKDLRKPKWESMAAEVENNKNDIIGALRYSYFSNIIFETLWKSNFGTFWHLPITSIQKI